MKSNNQKMKEDVFCVVESVSEQPSYSQADFIKFYEKQKKNGVCVSDVSAHSVL